MPSASAMAGHVSFSARACQIKGIRESIVLRSSSKADMRLVYWTIWCYRLPMSENYWSNRVADDKAREVRNERIIAASKRRDMIEWASLMGFFWILAMGIDFWKTIYAAIIEGVGPLAGLSAFIGLGVLLTGMIFAIWWRER